MSYVVNNDAIMNIQNVGTFSGEVHVIGVNQQEIKNKIKEADEALMLTWLGAAREYYNDASKSIRSRLSINHVTLLRCSQLMKNVSVDRDGIDKDAATAAVATEK